MNATQDMNGSPLFRLTLASQRDGLLDAVWRWRGEYLYLDDGQNIQQRAVLQMPVPEPGKKVSIRRLICECTLPRSCHQWS
jgi:hypothetical protein